MKLLFEIYQKLLSPFLHSFSKFLGGNPYSGCKFIPTCSVYSEQAIQTYGIARGGLKALSRICRCHPFSGPGGYDPV